MKAPYWDTYIISVVEADHLASGVVVPPDWTIWGGSDIGEEKLFWFRFIGSILSAVLYQHLSSGV